MSESAILSLFGLCLGVVIASSASIWYKLGVLTKAVRNSCPFGGCPLFRGTVQDTIRLVEHMREQGNWTDEQMDKEKYQ